MTPVLNTELDLAISRIIKAPRAAVWAAWADPRSFEQWWIPAPLTCKVMEMDLQPGGAFVTRMSENGQNFTPHLNACFLDIETERRIIFSNALTGGWRPAKQYYPTALTAIITFKDHPQGTDYAAHVMHKDAGDRGTHHEMGFADGWDTVIDQLAQQVESQQ